MRRFLTLSLILFGALQIISAQNLRGVVVDDANTPIADAYIFTKSEEHHCHSDAKGEFELMNSAPGDTMVVSFLGFGTREFILKERDFKNKFKVVLEGAVFNLEQVSVSNSIKSVSTLSTIDLALSPVQSSQQVLRRVPGLFIGQHAGGGKAEQIFLRGFDIDHGTDISITVDGMPVNMVSHAHGQGYADLHFLIPETIQNIDFAKGPYYSDQGNFTTAGYVNFKTKDKLDQSMFGIDVGDFNTFRTLGMFNLLGNAEKQNAYIATEYIASDGPFESPQNFNRFNVMGKYNVELDGGDRLSVIFSRFQSEWDASGQIPQRLVDNGSITRFGAVDDTEGGSTSRTNIAVDFSKNLTNNTLLKSNFYFSKYDFELFSNFTFFLEDPENSDQIRQHEDRQIYGFSTTLFKDVAVGENRLGLSAGAGLRYDDADDVVLSRTANRQETLEELSQGDVDETNVFGFVDAKWDLGDWLINAGLRLDAFNHNYNDLLQPTYTNQSEQTAILLPKLNIIYNPSTNLQLFAKAGRGFHSNDTRVVVAQSADEILPAAYGVDLGAVWKPAPRVWISPALWYLFLEQEFVYVGDAAIVEPSGKTSRQGVDLSMRFQLTNDLFFNADFNYTHARSIDDPEGENLIPLAPELTSVGGLSYVSSDNGFRASVNYRYIRDRAANEDNSIIAEGYFVTDLSTSYTFSNLTLGIEIENLLDTEWNEAQFATESRLKGELEPVEELHFTPGTPFFLKGIMRYKF